MKILDVFQVTAYIKDLIDDDPVLADIWVRGEVTNFTRSSAGHMYFSLTADGAQISCALFRGSQRGLLALPRGGESILAHGRISVYESRGQYQLIVDNVAPEGIGILQLQFDEMRRRLDGEGLFSPERKRPIPQLPAVIGVVTSPTGAVWHDIQTVIQRRFPLVELILAPSVVQGPDAPPSLIAALEALQRDARSEVIILARGGGSAEDLACFNDERLARAIFASRVPVVSAVGHQTDVTIADLVADLRAPTPSAAAELCVPHREEVLQVMSVLVDDSRRVAVEQLNCCREPLLLEISRVARRSPLATIERRRQDIDGLTADAIDATLRYLSIMRERTGGLRLASDHLNPTDILRRGYAIVTTTTSSPRRVTRVATASAAPRLALTFADGSMVVQPAKEET